MYARRPALAVLLCVTLLVAGCGGLLGTGGDPEAAADAKERALETGADVETYRSNVTASVDGRDELRNIEGWIAVDRTAEASSANYGLGTGGAALTSYAVRVTEETQYVRGGGNWSREPLQGRDRPLGTLLALLANASVSDDGTETVEGVETRRLSVDVDGESGLAAIRSVGSPFGLDVPSDVDPDTASATYFVATDTGHLQKVTLLVRGRAGPDNRKTYEATWTFHGYGDPVDVTVPQAE